MKYLLTTAEDTELIQQSIDTFNTIEEVEIKKLEMDLTKLSGLLWMELGANIDDEQELWRIARKLIEIIK